MHPSLPTHNTFYKTDTIMDILHGVHDPTQTYTQDVNANPLRTTVYPNFTS